MARGRERQLDPTWATSGCRIRLFKYWSSDSGQRNNNQVLELPLDDECKNQSIKSKFTSIY